MSTLSGIASHDRPGKLSSQCPHCRASLHMTDLVNCRWMEEVTQHLDNLQINSDVAASVAAGSSRNQQDRLVYSAPLNVNGLAWRLKVYPAGNGIVRGTYLSVFLELTAGLPETSKCDTHQEKLSVYCRSCERCICPRCALFGGHSGHSFKPIEEVYESHVQRIKAETVILRRRLLELVSCDTHQEKLSVYCRSCERCICPRCALFGGHSGHSFKPIEEVYESHVQRIKAETVILRRRLLELVSYSQEVETEQMEVLLQDLEARLGSNMSNIVETLDVMDVLKQIQNHVVYSAPLNVNGLAWRLKVYPAGNGIVRGTYLSVFLELTAGLPETSKYEYRVEMIHQSSCDSSKNIVREFASDFEIGECWGYNRFFRLDLLASEGYLNTENDTLILRSTIKNQHLTQINELKERLALDMSRNLMSAVRNSYAYSSSSSRNNQGT
ncbi:E3 ubiquitin-protein ligase TRIM37-like [Diaphorina citri]|uniref:E3 ubiquitin-protein ligase TRIM37-like n=1 Tax=Diaphorina citri TaxID=121845 RepID=A0A3Q0J5S3_DIACI|nr:E3 ubiquitin-protein ligase TRIM37-like [Diaphorina citri]